MKRLSVIIAYLLLSIGAVVGTFSLMALTSSTAYAHEHDSDEDDSRGSSRNVNESRPVKADGEVRIDNVAGTIKLKAWDKNEVSITGTLGPLVQRLEINSSDSGLEIRVILPHNVQSDDCDECADLEIQVPKGAHLEVSTVSADVQASGMTGPTQLGTVSGGVTLTSSSNHIDLRTVSGDITVVGSAKGAQVMANSVSGEVRLSDVDGSVDAENVSGEIKVVSRRINTLKMSSTSGDLAFQGDLLKGGNYDINNVSGDVDVTVGSSPDARFDVSSFSGDIDNNFGPRPSRVSKYSPGMELHFTNGSGAATLTARTLSGDIHIQD